mmetsp:Transcript_39792/g.81226  ORF Transcript_39792/g.81226 Transcript_39792/m.81226 type:complete len:456 (-) Transcript_39792:803-2170(-)
MDPRLSSSHTSVVPDPTHPHGEDRDVPAHSLPLLGDLPHGLVSRGSVEGDAQRRSGGISPVRVRASLPDLLPSSPRTQLRDDTRRIRGTQPSDRIERPSRYGHVHPRRDRTPRARSDTLPPLHTRTGLRGSISIPRTGHILRHRSDGKPEGHTPQNARVGTFPESSARIRGEDRSGSGGNIGVRARRRLRPYQVGGSEHGNEHQSNLARHSAISGVRRERNEIAAAHGLDEGGRRGDGDADPGRAESHTAGVHDRAPGRADGGRTEGREEEGTLHTERIQQLHEGDEGGAARESLEDLRDRQRLPPGPHHVRGRAHAPALLRLRVRHPRHHPALGPRRHARSQGSAQERRRRQVCGRGTGVGIPTPGDGHWIRVAGRERGGEELQEGALPVDFARLRRDDTHQRQRGQPEQVSDRQQDPSPLPPNRQDDSGPHGPVRRQAQPGIRGKRQGAALPH